MYLNFAVWPSSDRQNPLALGYLIIRIYLLIGYKNLCSSLDECSIDLQCPQPNHSYDHIHLTNVSEMFQSHSPATSYIGMVASACNSSICTINCSEGYAPPM